MTDSNNISHDLDGASVTGRDSLSLMRLAPHVKPAVKMMVPEFFDLAGASSITPEDVILFPGDGTVYVFSSKDCAAHFTADILDGNDSTALGYPEIGEETIVVTKDGRILSEYEDMKMEAELGNLIWGACGQMPDLQQYAERIREVIHMAKKKGGGKKC
jgi:hypothetical protein